jgi:uroporphyrinogen-III synthase
LLAFFEQHKAQLKHQYQFISFITTTPLAFELPANFDWVFFNSSNAVKWFYHNKETIKRKFKIAALSQGTADELNKLKVPVDFIGNGTIAEIALAFQKQLNEDEVVLFPLSNISKKSIPSQLKANQVLCVEVYETLLNREIVINHDVVLFTSPSNVQGYLVENKLPEICIAIGETTEKCLLDLDANVTQAASYQSNSWIPFLEASFS